MGRVFQIALRCREMRNFAWGIFFIGRWESDKEWFWRWPVCTNEVKKRYRNNATAKMKFLLVYNMNIVGGEESQTLVGNKNLLEGGGSLLGWLSEPGGSKMTKFLASGKNPLPIFLRGGLPTAAKTLMDVVKHAQSHSKQQLSYISRMCGFFTCG